MLVTRLPKISLLREMESPGKSSPAKDKKLRRSALLRSTKDKVTTEGRSSFYLDDAAAAPVVAPHAGTTEEEEGTTCTAGTRDR